MNEFLSKIPHNLQIQNLADLSWQDIGLLSVYLITIVFIVHHLSNFYSGVHKVSGKERLAIIVTGYLFGLLDAWIGDASIFFPVWGVFAYLLVVDIKYQELPDRANLIVAVMALPVVLQSFSEPSYWNWTLLTGVFLFLFFLFLLAVAAMGGGDVKMMGAVGLYFPLFEVPQLLVFGIGVAVLYSLMALFTNKDIHRKTELAFGPGLIIGVLLTSLI